MLKGIDPILNAEVLHALRAMGHGDDLILADTNFPAQSVAQRSGKRCYGRSSRREATFGSTPTSKRSRSSMGASPVFGSPVGRTKPKRSYELDVS